MNVAENRNLKSSFIPSGQYLRIYAGLLQYASKFFA